MYVPDYLKVIQHPMDLQTVREKLSVGNYATPKDFATDVRIIFDNSKTFNPNPLSMMYGQQHRLSILFEEQFHNIMTSYETRESAAGCK